MYTMFFLRVAARNPWDSRDIIFGVLLTLLFVALAIIVGVFANRPSFKSRRKTTKPQIGHAFKPYDKVEINDEQE